MQRVANKPMNPTSSFGLLRLPPLAMRYSQFVNQAKTSWRQSRNLGDLL